MADLGRGKRLFRIRQEDRPLPEGLAVLNPLGGESLRHKPTPSSWALGCRAGGFCFFSSSLFFSPGEAEQVAAPKPPSELSAGHSAPGTG